MGLFDGKVVIVTGGGGGIGKHISKAFAREGAKVVVNDPGTDITGEGRDISVADKVVEEIREEGGEAIAEHSSVADWSGAVNVVKTALDKFGRVDGVVNCAGAFLDKQFIDMSEQEFERIIRINLFTAFNIARATAKQIISQGTGGFIIFMTSIAGFMGAWGQSAFATAKAGLVGLTKTLSIELAKYGIRVNSVAPTARTRMTEKMPLIAEKGNELSPEHVAPVVLFLASDKAKDITGEIIAVYGRKIYSIHVTKTQGISKENGFWTPGEIEQNIKNILEI